MVRNNPTILRRAAVMIAMLLAAPLLAASGELIVEDVVPGGPGGYELGRGQASRLVPLNGEEPDGGGTGEADATIGFDGPWLRSSSNMLITVPENLAFPGINNPAESGSLAMIATADGAKVRNASRAIAAHGAPEVLWFSVAIEANREAVAMAEPETTTSLVAFLSGAPANFQNWDETKNRTLGGVGFGLLGRSPVVRYQSDATGSGDIRNAFFPEEIAPDQHRLFVGRLRLNARGPDVLDAWLLARLPSSGERGLGRPHVHVVADVLRRGSAIRHLSAIVKTPAGQPVPGNSVRFDAMRMATTYEAATSTNPFHLRTISDNVFRYHGWPRAEENRERREAASIQIPTRIAQELSLYEPDVVTFQEAHAEEVVAEIARLMGMHCVFFPSKSPRNCPGAVLSRFEIVASDNRPDQDADDLFTRHWGRAVIATPAGEISVHSLHLHPWRGEKEQAIRLRELALVKETLAIEAAAGRPIILQGDLNFQPDTPEYDFLREAGMVDVFREVGEGQRYTIPSGEPASRIDYIFVGGALGQSSYYSRVLFEGAFRTNLADSRSFALSDHLPVLADLKYIRE